MRGCRGFGNEFAAIARGVQAAAPALMALALVQSLQFLLSRLYGGQPDILTP
jgi:hypothetical protein